MSENINNFVNINKIAPEFETMAYNPNSDDFIQVSSKNFRGKWLVLFFYPGDFTFICSNELKDLSDNKAKFSEMWVEILTISTDSTFSHKAFAHQDETMKNFSYLMLADRNLEISKKYNISNEEGFAERWVFIIDPEWVCRSIEIVAKNLNRNIDELIRKIETLQFLSANPGSNCFMRKISPEIPKTSIKIAGSVAEEIVD